MATRYEVRKDHSEGAPYVGRRAWVAETKSRFPPGSGTVMYGTAVDVGKRVLQITPGYWVPWAVVVSYVRRTVTERGVGPETVLLVTPELDQAYYGKQKEIFVRRLPNVKVAWDVDKDERLAGSYRSYAMPPEVMVKLAFCLPTKFVSLEQAQAGVFPSIAKWGAQSAFTLSAMACMFPKLIARSETRQIRSLVREDYPEMSPVEGTEHTLEAEATFDVALTSETHAEARRELLNLAEEPCTSMFTPVDFERRKREGFKRVYSSKLGWISLPLDAPSMTDAEIADIIYHRIPEFSSVLMPDLLPLVSSHLNTRQHMMLRNGLDLRHDGRPMTFLRKHHDKFHIFQQKKETAHGNVIYENCVRRRDEVCDHEKGNPYLLMDNLLKAMLDCWAADTERRKSMNALQAQLPEAAKKAARRYGGLTQVILKHPGTFHFDKFANVVWLVTPEEREEEEKKNKAVAQKREGSQRGGRRRME